MSKIVKSFLMRFSFRIEWPGNMFDMSPGQLRYTPVQFDYPSTEDLWRSDWHNISCDFRSAFERLEMEAAH